jgi:ubiquinone/menaquinone biosynthesis C-methylase UbiE
MGEKKVLNVDDAYALETPADSVRLYGDWAPTYDSEFVDSTGYELFRHVAERFAELEGRAAGPVLDVGCGTGVVGACLREAGIEPIDGIDISAAMLAEAGKKTTADGDPVYRQLIEADLTTKLDMADNRYAGLVSAGTFTHGHLGPEPLDELWRIAAPGARCAIAVRSTHYASSGFADRLAADVARGTITEPKLVEVGLYAPGTPNREHAKDTAFVVVCQVLR